MRKKRLKLHRFEVNEIDRIKKRLEAVRSSYMKNFRDYEDVPLG